MRVVLGLVCLATSGGWVTVEAEESEPKLATLLERHFAAVGGRAKWAAVAGLHFRGAGQEGASTLKFDLHYSLPQDLTAEHLEIVRWLRRSFYLNRSVRLPTWPVSSR